MKVLVTDFDGTLCNPHSDDIDVESNVEALKRFQREGNIVVISTAREPKSLAKYIDKYDIPCDYVISYMGALIWDCVAEKYIFHNYFSKDIAEKILDMVEPYLSDCRLEIYSDVENPRIDQHIGYILWDEENCVYARMDNDFGRPVVSVMDGAKYYNEDFFTRIFPGQFFFINNTKNSKLTALEALINILLNEKKIDKDVHIYAIGDGIDDYETLKKYNGYRMKISEEELTKNYSKEIESVKEYVDILLKESRGD